MNRLWGHIILYDVTFILFLFIYFFNERFESNQNNGVLAITGALRIGLRERLCQELALESLEQRRQYRKTNPFSFYIIDIYFINLGKSALNFAVNATETISTSQSTLGQIFGGRFPDTVCDLVPGECKVFLKMHNTWMMQKRPH